MAKTSKAKKTVKELPKFLVQHTKDEQFLFCVEIKGVYQCWRSFYPPPTDSRYKRALAKTANQPIAEAEKKTKDKDIWDEGTYEIGKAKTKKEAELAFLSGLTSNRLSFLLHGKKLEGRFILRYDPSSDSLLIYKQKDKFEKEEDPLGMELQRSMNKWVQDYDPDKIVLGRLKKAKVVKKAAGQEHEEPVIPVREEVPSVDKPVKKEQTISARLKKVLPKKQLRKTKNGFKAEVAGESYLFSFYKPMYSEEKTMLCVVASDSETFLIRSSRKGMWDIAETTEPGEDLGNDLIELIRSYERD